MCGKRVLKQGMIKKSFVGNVVMQTLRHLAITPDGNRRYAKKHNLSFQAAYLAGFDKVKDVLDWSTEPEKITLWALSLDNFVKRSSFELKILFKLMEKRVNESLQKQSFVDRGVRVKFFGKRDLLPAPAAIAA